MYELINMNIQTILQSLEPSFIDTYDNLMQDRNLVADPDYQNRYMNFYRPRGLSSDFCRKYFNILPLLSGKILIFSCN